MHALPKGHERGQGPDKQRTGYPRYGEGHTARYHGVFAYKDGTARFDATDVPITHFYPKEFGISVERLRQLGYTTDYLGNDLMDDTQLVELMHQDVILNKQGAEYLLEGVEVHRRSAGKVYGLEPFYNVQTVDDLIGQLV